MLVLMLLLAGHITAVVELAGSPAGLAALAATAAAALLLTLVVPERAALIAGPLVASAVRQRGERTAFLPLCDPNAVGRPHPRAPSSRPRVA
ncbi:MAG TPA: DUF6412 domain-containing protein [Jiangellaceae bacterium]|nr:DUF6412 domain-containing protein [Jiangellaceae bacterium]